jgi:uncharacterized phiE125 gp8 family phage protein
MQRFKTFYHYEIKTPASELPLTLNEVKTHLNIVLSDNSKDAYLTDLIKAVSNFFEKYTNRDLINKTYNAYLDCFVNYFYCINYSCDNYYNDGIKINKSKVSIVNSIKYLKDDVLTEWDASNYYLDKSNFYSAIRLKENKDYPSDVDNIRQAIVIEFVSGFGADNTSIPNDIKIALLNHIAFLYENRGDCDSGMRNNTSTRISECKLPCATKTIYSSYKIFNLIN